MAKATKFRITTTYIAGANPDAYSPEKYYYQVDKNAYYYMKLDTSINWSPIMSINDYVAKKGVIMMGNMHSLDFTKMKAYTEVQLMVDWEYLEKTALNRLDWWKKFEVKLGADGGIIKEKLCNNIKWEHIETSSDYSDGSSEWKYFREEEIYNWLRDNPISGDDFSERYYTMIDELDYLIKKKKQTEFKYRSPSAYYQFSDEVIELNNNCLYFSYKGNDTTWYIEHRELLRQAEYDLVYELKKNATKGFYGAMDNYVVRLEYDDGLEPISIAQGMPDYGCVLAAVSYYDDDYKRCTRTQNIVELQLVKEYD